MKSKQKHFLLFILCFFSYCSFAQNTSNTTLLKSESPVWGEWSMTIGRSRTPFLIDEKGDTYGGGWSEGFTAMKMYSLSKPAFSLGWFLTGQYVNYSLELDAKTYKILPFRAAVGPAVAIRKPIKDYGVTYLSLGTGVKWDYHYKDIPAGFHYCQNAWSPVACLSLSYAGRLDKELLEGIGIKASVYSYGNSKGINVKSPIIDYWELGVCWYFYNKKLFR